MYRRILLVLALCAGAAHLAGAQTQPRREIIQGLVTTDSAAAIAGATVYATMAPNREVFQATTDADGRYRIEIANGTGDYLLHISAVGRRPFRKRLLRDEVEGFAGTFTVDAQLAPEVTELPAVRVQATRPRPSREGPGIAAEPGSAERIADGVHGAVPPDAAGDIAALAATVPGIAITPAGVTVFGLDPAQSRTTVNGMAFPGAEVPRDIRTRTRVYSGTYDPARGGFSGAQIDVELAPGSSFSSRNGRFSADAPFLQTRDPIAAGLSQRFARLDGSLTANGSMREDRWHYNAGAQFRRHSADVLSLVNATAEELHVAGAAPDSVLRAVAAITAAGIPIAPARDAGGRTTDELVLMGRLDHGRYKPGTFQAADHSWNVTTYARLAQTHGIGLAPLSTGSRGASQHASSYLLQGTRSSYFGPRKEWLHELRSAVSRREERTEPWALFPEGRVLLSSTLQDGSVTAATLSFGGNPLMDARSRAWTWETISETQFFAQGRSRHRVKLYAQSRFDRSERSGGADLLGTYSFNSLTDLLANVPASYTRTLDAPVREGSQWSGALALGDLYRRSRSFQLLYGARVEANAFTRRPAFNPEVEQLFGVRNDFAPNRLHVSPRAGFTWSVRGGNTSAGGMAMSRVATMHTGPRGVIRGGIGEFRNLMPATLLADASANTGLPDGARRVLCIGDAVPIPDWSAYASGTPAPAACADGTPAFTDSAPLVQLFSRGYDAPRSWRGNLSWSSGLRRFDYSIEGIYSRNLDQPGLHDLNFAGIPRFTLDAEGGRPVYVPSSAVVEATGAVAAAESRLSQSYGRVLSRHSGLSSTSRQFTFAVSPNILGGRWPFVRAAYTYGTANGEVSGFDAPAFGDPRVRERAPTSFDTRHQLQLSFGWQTRLVAATAFARFASGLPYTPIVRGDVNGDGVSGDRAFIFDPAGAPGPEVAAAMRALLESGSGSARDCLARQLGRPAGINSCRGPWTGTMNAQLALGRGAMPWRSQRATVALNFANVLGGVDQLLHGRNLRGWGAMRMPDPVLYTVRGFDPDARQFRYEVNQRFGSASPAHSLARAPFRVTLDVRVDLGKPIAQQQLERWLTPGRAGDPRPRLTADSLRSRYARNVPDLYAGILQLSDSLLLSREQVAALQAAQDSFRVRMDSIWRDLADYMASLPDQYDGKAALERQESTLDAAWELSRQEAQTRLPRILNELQLRLLPWPAGMLHRAPRPFGPENRIRVFSG